MTLYALTPTEQIRLARHLRLHRDPAHLPQHSAHFPRTPNLCTPLDTKHVQRLFWSIVVKDVHRNWQQLNPSLLKEGDSDVLPPQWRPRRTQEYFSAVGGARDVATLKKAETNAPPPHFDHAEALWLEFLLRLTLLTRRGAAQMATPVCATQGCPAGAVRGYLSGLERWLNDFPDAIKWETITSGHTSFESLRLASLHRMAIKSHALTMWHNSHTVLFRWLLYENGVALSGHTISHDNESGSRSSDSGTNVRESPDNPREHEQQSQKQVEDDARVLEELEDAVEARFVRCFWRTDQLAEQGAKFRTMRGCLCVGPVLIRACILLSLEILSRPKDAQPAWRSAKVQQTRPAAHASSLSLESGPKYLSPQSRTSNQKGPLDADTPPSRSWSRPLMGLPGWGYYASLFPDPADQHLVFSFDKVREACFRLVAALESYDTDLCVIDMAAQMRRRVSEFFSTDPLTSSAATVPETEQKPGSSGETWDRSTDTFPTKPYRAHRGIARSAHSEHETKPRVPVPPTAPAPAPALTPMYASSRPRPSSLALAMPSPRDKWTYKTAPSRPSPPSPSSPLDQTAGVKSSTPLTSPFGPLATSRHPSLPPPSSSTSAGYLTSAPPPSFSSSSGTTVMSPNTAGEPALGTGASPGTVSIFGRNAGPGTGSGSGPGVEPGSKPTPGSHLALGASVNTPPILRNERASISAPVHASLHLHYSTNLVGLPTHSAPLYGPSTLSSSSSALSQPSQECPQPAYPMHQPEIQSANGFTSYQGSHPETYSGTQPGIQPGIQAGAQPGTQLGAHPGYPPGTRVGTHPENRSGMLPETHPEQPESLAPPRTARLGIQQAFPSLHACHPAQVQPLHRGTENAQEFCTSSPTPTANPFAPSFPPQLPSPYLAHSPSRPASAGQTHTLPPLSQSFPPLQSQMPSHFPPHPSIPLPSLLPAQEGMTNLPLPVQRVPRQEPPAESLHYDPMSMLKPAELRLSLVENITLESMDWFDGLIPSPGASARAALRVCSSTPGEGSGGLQTGETSGSAVGGMDLPQSSLHNDSVSSFDSLAPSHLKLSPTLTALAPVAGTDARHWVDAAWNGDQLV